jgi:Undecaprenyl-phosphate glucose phosphotransferase
MVFKRCGGPGGYARVGMKRGSVVLKKYNRLMVVLLAITDILITFLALFLAYAIRFWCEPFLGIVPIEHGVPPLESFLHPTNLAVIGLLWVTIFYFNGLYRPRRGKSLIDEFFLVVTSVTLAVIVLLGLLFFFRPSSYSRVVVVLFVVLDIGLLTGSRLVLRSILKQLRRRGYNQRQVVIAGAGQLGQTLLEKFEDHPGLGFEVVGFVDDDPQLQGQSVGSYPVLGRLDDLKGILRKRSFDQVFLALPMSNYERMCRVIGDLKDELVTIKFVPDILQYITFRAGTEELDGLPVINFSEIPMTGWSTLIKRGLDVAGALALIMLFGPVMLACAALIKATSKGPTVFRQDRMGMDGKTFTMYKFRSMRHSPSTANGWTQRNDTRVTAIGRFMRKWSLDELPQLFNVLNGTMSLVGPRPEQPLFVSEFRQTIPRYMLRHRVKSGMTGWAQVHGLRGDTSVEKRIEFDLYYIENWTLGLDVKILLLTLFRVRLNAH